MELGLQTVLRMFHLKKAAYIFFQFEPSKGTPTNVSHQKKRTFSNKLITCKGHRIFTQTLAVNWKPKALILQNLNL